MKRFFAIATLVILALSLSCSLLAQSDPFLGTWKLNPKKSRFAPGAERKSETRVAVSSPMGLKVSVKRANGDGSVQEYEYTANLDGKNYPIVGQGPYGADSIGVNLTAANTLQSILTKDSKVVATGTSVVSAGGKVLTITVKSGDASGKQLSSVAVYDKR
jgi:hypothetical protein